MKRFKNILIVFNSNTDNRALLFHAVDLAQRNRASLKVVDVIEETPSKLPKPGLQKPAGEVPSPTINIFEELISIPPVSPSSESRNKEWKSEDDTTEKMLIDIQEYIIQEEKRNLQQFVTAIQQAGIPVSSKTFIGIPFIEIIKEVLRNQHDLVMITAEGSGNLMDIRFGNTTVHLMRKCPCPFGSSTQPKQTI
jgi:nucleotide-binding universal stress UspA family protein